jgi:hypothetical protein
MTVRTILFAAASMTAFGHHGLHAQEAGDMIVRVYPVANLVRSVPDYPYEAGLPTSGLKQFAQSAAAITGGGLGGGGFGGGGAGLGGGLGGGGFFQIDDQATGGARDPSPQQQLDLNALIAVITTSIAPDSWNFSGGQATIVALGTSLVVRQTPDVHKEIQTLLQALSQMSDRQTMVTIRAFLITMPPGTTFDKDVKAATNIEELHKAAEEVGEITCFSGQRVHLAKGQRRNVVTSLIPVVSALAVGYQPQIVCLHIGSLLEFTATVDPGGKSAMLDARCTVTDWNEAGDPIKITSEFGPGESSAVTASAKSSGGRSEGTIDRINIGTRQLATTVRVPVTAEGEPAAPVIVGTLGRPSPAADEKDEAAGVTYLVVAVSR